MFDFDPGKLVVFGVVALAVIPPKDLPRVLRTVGKYVGQMRRMAADFQGQFMDAMKEVELESVKQEIAEINKAAKLDASFDPAKTMREHVEEAVEGKSAPVLPAPSTPEPSVPEPSIYETVTVGPPVAVEAAEPAEKAVSNAS